MKARTRAVTAIVLITLLWGLAGVLPAGACGCSPGKAVDDLRGRWEFVVSEGLGEPVSFELYINDTYPDPESETGLDYLASGCMASPGVEGRLPLLLRATDLCDGTYSLNLLSTALPPDGNQGFVMQFMGGVAIHGPGVPDDEAGGQFRTAFADGGWTGTHHDRRRTECPAVDIPSTPGLYFNADVYVHHAYWGEQITRRSSPLEAYTNIVSVGIRVEWPDGTVVVVPFYTDIFSPGADFISEFRYLAEYSGDPIDGRPYQFGLLSALGNPILGATATDVWTGCQTYPPPRDLAHTMHGSDIDLTWTAVPDAPGFDPDGSGGQGRLGMYQVAAWPDPWAPTSYGANVIGVPEHAIPWLRHAQWDMENGGSPDGADHGNALSELDPGLYQIQVLAFSVPAPADPAAGHGHECAVFDQAENLFFQNDGLGITFVTFGSISGTVRDVDGNPLAGIGVDVEQGGFGACTDENGFYLMRQIPLGTYNLVAGRPFCGAPGFGEQVAGVTLTEDDHDQVVDFSLEWVGP